MLIQRRPGASTISTRGSSRSGVRSAARDRAERRPKGERGRLGMARTERLVGRRHHGIRFYAPGRYPARRLRCYDSPAHSSTHPEGWRDWPVETPPTISRERETVAIPSGSKRWPGRCGQGIASTKPPPHHYRPEVFPYAGRCPEVQGVFDHLSARGALRVRAVLRPARGGLPRSRRRAPRSSSAASRRARTRCGATPTSCRSEGARARRALPTGWTPLVKADRLAERLGLR